MGYLWTKWAIMHFRCWILRMISVDVLAQCFFQDERFRAMRTFERTFAAVRHQMTLQNLLLDEWTVANTAWERLLPGVDANMSSECAVAGEPFLTIWTLLTVGFCTMISFMIDQFTTPWEGFRAFRTSKYFQIARFITLIAWIRLFHHFNFKLFAIWCDALHFDLIAIRSDYFVLRFIIQNGSIFGSYRLFNFWQYWFQKWCIIVIFV